MVKLAVAGEPGLREGEPGDHGVRHHTMREFEALMSRHPEYDFVFIVGTEVLEGIEFWDEAAAVVARAEFAVVRRPGQEDAEAAAIDSDLAVEWFDMDEYAEASSGKVRRALKVGEAADLHEAVRRYIEEKALYSS
jgi:nicotinic acid mononucleotide adenylyltransferase